MLRNDLAVTIANRRATTLFESAKVIVIHIIIQCTGIFFSLSLLFNSYLFILRVNLVLKESLVVSSLQFTLRSIIWHSKNCAARVDLID